MSAIQKDELPKQRDIMDDFAAHNHAMSKPIQDVVKELVDLLGATSVAAIGGVSETRAVQGWMSEREPQRPHVLRFALQIATMIASASDREPARAWFHGCNPHLEDQVPLLLLRNKPLAEIQQNLMMAARAFASRVSEATSTVASKGIPG